MESQQGLRNIQQNSSFWEPKYYLMVIIFCFLIYFFLKNNQNKQEPIKDKVWKKFAFAYQDMMNTFDDPEKELLKHTFHNTIFNTKPPRVNNDKRKQSKKTSNVSFDLAKNVTHMFQQNGY
ncbi:unnamed protein product (macronuclear) [Paramecium tetraurelia]|uniref:Uncharacterized protein n=1 Tax=Paramecium tetraurelia TaxID=5888 RepID=A0EHD7_PARTE|nr:uncharacterized protein GSPATT00027052001 [Paramecium tetraurelia]CAK94728.1 unnamed protein product [Paramecium tetraurelia]|eukprot:XP_001462101.1 hypothetical protein (macronuclear) [Paramecium tetraurelia strain d4-2]